MKNIGLLFTRGESVTSWFTTGLLQREKQIYHGIIDKYPHVIFHWFTYNSKDIELVEELKKSGELYGQIYVHTIPKLLGRSKFSLLVYSILMPFIHYDVSKNLSLIKSNQMDGAWAGILFKLFFNKQFYLRTGYTLSIFSQKQNELKYWLSRIVERVCYIFADRIAVSSKFDKKYIYEEFHPNREITVMRNFIDTNLFYDSKNEREESILYVGRFTEQKNLENFLYAISKFKIKISFVGDGEQLAIIKALAEKLNVNALFLGRLENDKLPQVLNKHRYYVLPSLYEGMPKTLLEAMACGCICLGTDVQGINEVLTSDCGILSSGTSTKELELAINQLLAYDNEDKGTKAIEVIKSDFSLEKIIDIEEGLLGLSNEKNY